MYALVAYFKNGDFDLVGFVNSSEEAERMTDSYITENGADYLGSMGVNFCVELAA